MYKKTFLLYTFSGILNGQFSYDQEFPFSAFIFKVCFTWRGEVSPVQVHGHAEALHSLGPGHAPEAGHVQHASSAPFGGHVVGHVVHALLRHVTRNLKLVRRKGAAFNRKEKVEYTVQALLFH
jgi:hypothetical protein